MVDSLDLAVAYLPDHVKELKRHVSQNCSVALESVEKYQHVRDYLTQRECHQRAQRILVLRWCERSRCFDQVQAQCCCVDARNQGADHWTHHPHDHLDSQSVPFSGSEYLRALV